MPSSARSDVMARGPADVLQLLANPTNRAILSVLAIEPQYPRRLAEVVGLTEDEASKRLRLFERLGLAEAEWANLGKTVRLYRLASARITVSVTGQGILVGGLGESAPVEVGAAAESVPVLQRFVGRAREMGELRALLASRRAACVHGLGGVGKTSLAASVANAEGRPVLWHTLAPGESGTLLLTRLANAARAMATGDRAQRLLGLRTGDDGGLLIDAVASAANDAGAIVVLDRFEGAGDGAGDVVAHLARRLADARLLVTSRAFPREFPRDLIAAFKLEGMSVEDTSRLLAELSSHPPEAQVARDVHVRTRGHPLSLVLLALAGPPTSESILEEDGIRDFLLGDVIPQLPEAERDVLLSLCVLRGPFLAEEAEAVADRKHARDALLRLEARGLVLRAGQTFAIHDLVRAFAADAVPEARKVHARAAKVLLAAGEPGKALEALHHLTEAGDVLRAASIVREELLHRSYRFFDHGHASVYRSGLLRMEALPSLKPADRACVLIELAMFGTHAGDVVDAAKRIDEAAPLVARAARELAVPLLIARGRLLHLRESAKEAAEAYAEAAASADDKGMLLRCVLDQAFCCEEWSDAEAGALYERAIAVGQETSDLRLLSLAYAGAARIAARIGAPGQMERADEALRLARISGYLRGEASVYMTLVTHAMSVGDHTRGREYADRYLHVAEVLGDPWVKACALADFAFLLLGGKRYQESEVAAERALVYARSISNDYYALSAAVVLAESRLGRNDPAGARDALEPLLVKAPEVWPAMLSRGWLAIARARESLGELSASEARARAAKYDKGSPWADPTRMQVIRSPGGMSP